MNSEWPEPADRRQDPAEQEEAFVYHSVCTVAEAIGKHYTSQHMQNVWKTLLLEMVGLPDAPKKSDN